MRKKMSCLAAALVLCAAVTPVFAAETPPDVKNTDYEYAVNYLLLRDAVTGDPDGNFRPNDSINRAEACTIIVKSISPSAAALEAAKDSGFTDMASYSWAEKYINYAVEKGIVSGKGNGRFKPEDPVTYTEYAAMILNAFGVPEGGLSGSWPDNYYSLASDKGLFTMVMEDEEVELKDRSATRGDVANMTAMWGDLFQETSNLIIPVSTYTEGGLTDVFITRWFAFSVDSAAFVDEYAGYKPAAGNLLLDTVVTVKNTCGMDVPMFDTDFWIDWGDDLDFCLDAIEQTMIPSEFTMKPNEVFTYHLVFEVPESSKDGEYAFGFVEIYEETEENQAVEDLYGNWFHAYFTVK